MGPGRHHPAYVGGRSVDTDEVTYGVDVAALLDPAGSADLWERLLAGDPGVATHSYVIGSVAMAGEPLVKEAIEAAAEAAPRWARVPLATRLAMIGRARQLLLAHREPLTELMMAEGHPRVLAEWQVTGGANALDERSVAWWATQMEQELDLDGRRMRLVRRPDGVVCVNPPRHAPTGNGLLALGPLAAGNSVVVRVPRSLPMSLSYLLAEVFVPALEECQAPPGTLNVICADQPSVMQQWLDSPLVSTIFYFGTSAYGIELEQRCVAAGKKPVLELSGNDGVLVWRDADLDHAAAALGEAFLGSGQICMAPNHVLAHPAIADELLERLVAVAGEQRAGHPSADGVTLSPVLRPDRFAEALDSALAGGARLVCGGRRIDRDGRPDDRGLFVEPTVVRIDGLPAAATHRVVREETFFPLLPVVVPEPGGGGGGGGGAGGGDSGGGGGRSADDPDLLDRMIAFLNANRYGLRNSLWARDPVVIDQFVARVTNGGNLRVNESHLAFHRVLPTHGGAGLTGGVWGEANYPILRTSRLQAAVIAPGHDSPAATRTRLW